MKDNNKLEKIIKVMLIFWQNTLTMKDDIFMNHVYKMNIETLYKGSEIESNWFLRFKERFKRQYKLAYGYAIESMGR